MAEKKPTKKEISRAMKVLKLKTEQDAASYFKCQCPFGLSNGRDGLFHCVPIDCSTTKEDIIAGCDYRLKHFDRRIKEIIKLKINYAKRK